MTKEEAYNSVKEIWEKLLNPYEKKLNAYQDYLDVMKGFLGENSPLITKFEDLLLKLRKDYEMSLKAANQIFNKAVEKDVDRSKSQGNKSHSQQEKEEA